MRRYEYSLHTIIRLYNKHIYLPNTLNNNKTHSLYHILTVGKLYYNLNGINNAHLSRYLTNLLIIYYCTYLYTILLELPISQNILHKLLIFKHL